MDRFTHHRKNEIREGTVIDADDLLTETTTLIMNEFNKTKNKTNIDGKNSDDSNVVDGKEMIIIAVVVVVVVVMIILVVDILLFLLQKKKRARLIALSAIKFYLLKMMQKTWL